MFSNYFNDHIELTLITKGKKPSKFTMDDIKFHGIENPYHI